MREIFFIFKSFTIYQNFFAGGRSDSDTDVSQLFPLSMLAHPQWDFYYLALALISQKLVYSLSIFVWDIWIKISPMKVLFYFWLLLLLLFGFFMTYFDFETVWLFQDVSSDSAREWQWKLFWFSFLNFWRCVKFHIESVFVATLNILSKYTFVLDYW